jgi:endonuclease/exonuclease/phosphatase family metal-dependent hydrolase
MSSAALRVMSVNVRIPVDPGDDAWEVRRPVLSAAIRDAAPDLIGVQELKLAPAADLLADLPEYRMLGRDRFGGRDDEHCAILWRDDRLELVEHGDFWLSDTPDEVASITWGTVFPRYATWARMRLRASGDEVLFASTHLPYRPEDEGARELGASLLAERLVELAGGPGGAPVVLTGDFNTGPSSGAHAAFDGVLADVHDTAPHTGPDGTFHGFTGEPGERIDWILQRGCRPVASATLTPRDGAVHASDHFPVVADLELA